MTLHEKNKKFKQSVGVDEWWLRPHFNIHNNNEREREREKLISIVTITQVQVTYIVILIIIIIILCTKKKIELLRRVGKLLTQISDFSAHTKKTIYKYTVHLNALYKSCSPKWKSQSFFYHQIVITKNVWRYERYLNIYIAIKYYFSSYYYHVFFKEGHRNR